MIFIGQNNESGQLHMKKHPPTGTPENTGRTYVVRRCGPVYEVRCVTRAGGKVTGDQLVAAMPTEQEAEAAARWLANPVDAKDRGKRVLEDIIEGDSP